MFFPFQNQLPVANYQLSISRFFEWRELFTVTKTMSIKYFLFVFLCFLFFTGGQTLAQSLKLPYVDKNVCPFECCEYREWVATKATTVYKEMRDGSAAAFTVKKGEKVDALTGIVITTKPGQVRILQNTNLDGLSVKKGDILSILTYHGEGFFTVWHKGKFSQIEILDERTMKVLSQPKSIWWVKMKNKKGKIGWTRLPENFDNKDSCA
jgi:hypothetical protein